MLTANLTDLRLVGDTEQIVTRESVTAFADTIGETDPLCHDPHAAAAAGFAGLVAPPGFVFVLAYRLSIGIIAAAGIDPDGITHVAEAQRLTRPITSGDALRGTASATSYRETGGLALFSWQVDVTDRAGEPVGSTTTAILIRGDGGWPERRAPAPWRPPADEVARHRFAVTRGQVARYCGISGDAHPVHWSDRIARQSGLGGVIMHGSLLLAVVGRAATASAGGVAGVAELGARFAMPVEVPDDKTGCPLDVATGAPARTGRLPLEVGVHGHRVLTAATATLAHSPH